MIFAGHAAVVVFCVGLLFTVLAVGVVRLRAAYKRALREEAEVEMVKHYFVNMLGIMFFRHGMMQC